MNTRKPLSLLTLTHLCPTGDLALWMQPRSPEQKRKDFSLVITLSASCYLAEKFKAENMALSPFPDVSYTQFNEKNQQPTTFHISDLFFS